ncbi:MAG TPA: Uma2 family endonuclease [Polyangiaceae bacterium]
MAQPALPLPAPPELQQDSIVVLRNATWADFQRVLELKGDSSVPRVAYLEGVLELMSPSQTHEAAKSMIGCLVEAWCIEKGVDITPYGSWTHEDKESQRGIEPDECYVLGDSAEPKRCDLAIEIIWTSGSIDKLEIYRKLRVREVWFWKRGAISVHELDGERYRAIAASQLLAGIDLAELLEFVDIRPMTRAVREYRARLAARAAR